MTKLVTSPSSRVRMPRFTWHHGHRVGVSRSVTRTLLIAASAPLLVFLTVPLVALLLRVSPLVLIENLRTPVVREAVLLSALTSLLAVALSLLAGTPLAYMLARYSFPGHRIVDTLIDLPMVLPPSVAGIALLITFGRRGLVGQHLNVFGVRQRFET